MNSEKDIMSETVDEVVGELHQALLSLDTVEFTVEADTLLS